MKCSFCGTSIKAGTGKMFVKSDGTITYYCSSKCESSYKRGTEPKKKKWARKK